MTQFLDPREVAAKTEKQRCAQCSRFFWPETACQTQTQHDKQTGVTVGVDDLEGGCSDCGLCWGCVG